MSECLSSKEARPVKWFAFPGQSFCGHLGCLMTALFMSRSQSSIGPRRNEQHGLWPVGTARGVRRSHVACERKSLGSRDVAHALGGASGNWTPRLAAALLLSKSKHQLFGTDHLGRNVRRCAPHRSGPDPAPGAQPRGGGASRA